MPVANFATYASIYSIKNSFYFINKLKLQFLVKKNWDWTHDLSVTRQPSCLLFHHKGLRGNGMFCKQERSFVAYLFCMWQTSVKFFYYSRPIEHCSTAALWHWGLTLPVKPSWSFEQSQQRFFFKLASLFYLTSEFQWCSQNFEALENHFEA